MPYTESTGLIALICPLTGPATNRVISLLFLTDYIIIASLVLPTATIIIGPSYIEVDESLFHALILASE